MVFTFFKHIISWRIFFTILGIVPAALLPARHAKAITINTVGTPNLAGTNGACNRGVFTFVVNVPEISTFTNNDTGTGEDRYRIVIFQGNGTEIGRINLSHAGTVNGVRPVVVALNPTIRPWTIRIYDIVNNADGNINEVTAPGVPQTFDPAKVAGGGSCNVLPLASTIILDGQQQMFSGLIINRTAQNFIEGMRQNIQGRLNGNGPLSATSNGFFVQSAGMQNWLYRRRREIAKKQDSHMLRVRARRIPDRTIRDQSTSDITVQDSVDTIPDGVTDPAADPNILPVADYPARIMAQPSFNIWAKGAFTFFDGQGSSFDGHLADIVAGIDYKLSQNFLIGILEGYNKADFDTISIIGNGNFKAKGFSIGPYLGVKLSDNFIFDALIAYTRSDYDNRAGATKGNFNANRLTLAANVTGRWNFHSGLFIEPSISLSYAVEKQENYTDSVAVFHAANTIKAGRLSVGPKIGKAFKLGNGTISPWIAGYLVYDFSNASRVPGSSLPDLGDLTTARLAKGLSIDFNGLKITLQGDITGLGTKEYTAYGGSAKVNVPF